MIKTAQKFKKTDLTVSQNVKEDIYVALLHNAICTRFYNDQALFVLKEFSEAFDDLEVKSTTNRNCQLATRFIGNALFEQFLEFDAIGYVIDKDSLDPEVFQQISKTLDFAYNIITGGRDSYISSYYQGRFEVEHPKYKTGERLRNGICSHYDFFERRRDESFKTIKMDYMANRQKPFKVPSLIAGRA